MRFRRQIQKAKSTHHTGLVGPHDLRVAGDPAPTVDLESEARLAALDRSDGLKSAALFGKIEHDAAVLAPQLQVHQLLGAPTNDRPLILFHRFDFHINLSDLCD